MQTDNNFSTLIYSDKTTNGRRGESPRRNQSWRTPARRRRRARDPWSSALPRRVPGRLVCRHLAAGTVPQRGRWRQLGAVLPHQRRCALPALDGHGAGRHPGRTETALDPGRPARRGASLLRHVRRRRARIDRRRPQLHAAGKGTGGGRGLRPRQPRLPRSALPAPVPERSGPPVSTEPLRHLPPRPARRNLAAHRPQDAETGGRHRFPDGGASTRCRHRLGVPDGWHHGVAAHQPGGQAGEPA